MAVSPASICTVPEPAAILASDQLTSARCCGCHDEYFGSVVRDCMSTSGPHAANKTIRDGFQDASCGRYDEGMVFVKSETSWRVRSGSCRPVTTHGTRRGRALAPDD
jgi:hypothetical protein